MESESKSFDPASESLDDYVRRLGLYEIWVQGRYEVKILGDGRVWLELVNIHSEPFLNHPFRGTLTLFKVSDLWPSKPETAVEALWKMTRCVLPPDVKIPDPELVVSYVTGLGGTVPVGLIPSVKVSMEELADELRLAEQAFIQPMKGIQRVLRVCLAEADFGKYDPGERTLYVPGISEPPWLWGVWEQIKRCEERALIVELLAAFLDGAELFDPSIPKPLGGAQYGGVLYYLHQIDVVRRIIGEKARRWLSLRIILKAAVDGKALEAGTPETTGAAGVPDKAKRQPGAPPLSLERVLDVFEGLQIFTAQEPRKKCPFKSSRDDRDSMCNSLRKHIKDRDLGQAGTRDRILRCIQYAREELAIPFPEVPFTNTHIYFKNRELIQRARVALQKKVDEKKDDGR